MHDIDQYHMFMDLCHEVENYDREEEPAKEEDDYTMCPKCNVRCGEDDYELVCPNCGLTRRWDSDISDLYCKSIELNYNTWENQFNLFSIVGKDVRGLRTCLKLFNSSYDAYRDQEWRSQLEQKLKSYTGLPIPDSVVITTLQYFKAIKEAEIIYRGRGAWYIMGACMVNAFIANQIPRKREDICEIVGIDKTNLSYGENQIIKLNNHGIIDIPVNKLSYETYLLSYMQKLEIDERFLDFLINIINLAEIRFVHIRSETWAITKCVGVIYFLCQCTDLRNYITKETISKKCQISQSTFMRYYNLLVENVHLFRKLFRDHNIPYKREWVPKTIKKLKELRDLKLKRASVPYVYFALGYSL